MRAERISTPLLLWLAAAIAACILSIRQVIVHLPDPQSSIFDLQQIILMQSVFPRVAIAIVAGATLSLSGLLLQRVLRNPLAEPSTLGVSAGAQLAMAAAAIYAPSLAQFSVSLVALGGGLFAAALVLALTWRRGLEPVSVVLAGMMIALTANAASAALILANGEYLFSLFIWGGGSLVQQGWGPTSALAIRLALGFGAALLLLRPLTIAGLGDGTAKALGMAINASRLLVIALAVWMATSVAAEVGVIGFIGLAAPALARLSGARTLRQQIIAAPLLGALLLWLTDELVRLFASDGGERIPTGAATALLGGPLLIWLLPRLRLFEWPSVSAISHPVRRAAQPYALVGGLALLVFGIALIGLFLGKGPDGWTIATGERLYALLDLRAPRLAVAAAAGGMLAAAGVVIQRITGNPLASPEILGVGAGAGAGLAAVLIVAGVGVGLGWQLAGSAIGAMAVLIAITIISARGSMGPERLLFAGIAVNALCSSVLTAVIALGNQQSQLLLQWLSGSTSSATMSDAWVALAGLAMFALPLFLAARWLALLPLGFSINTALGVPVRRARFLLVVASSLLTATASMFVGPLSFVGLIAPHMARLLGLSRPWAHLAGSLLLGCGLMMLSDWLGRMVAFPYQLPVGLFASLIGGPYLIYLLARGVPRNV